MAIASITLMLLLIPTSTFILIFPINIDQLKKWYFEEKGGLLISKNSKASYHHFLMWLGQIVSTDVEQDGNVRMKTDGLSSITVPSLSAAYMTVNSKS
jgi:hypothetical protein